MAEPNRPFDFATNKELGCLYDGLYLAGQRLLDKYKPCNIRPSGKLDKGGSALMFCTGYNSPWYCCCGGCKYIGKNGCTVKALSCKLWLCIEVKRANPELAKKMQSLLRIASEHGLLSLRTPKEQVLSRIYR